MVAGDKIYVWKEVTARAITHIVREEWERQDSIRLIKKNNQTGGWVGLWTCALSASAITLMYLSTDTKRINKYEEGATHLQRHCFEQ